MKYTVTILCVVLVALSGWAQTLPSSHTVVQKDYFVKTKKKKQKKKLVAILIENQRIPADMRFGDRIAQLSYADLQRFTYAITKNMLVFNRKKPPYDPQSKLYQSFGFVRDSLYFLRVNFRNADFENIIFQEEADFKECHFESSVGFTYSTFQKEANYNGSVFTSTQNAEFTNVRFLKAAYLASTFFRQGAIFRNARFSDIAIFHGAVFAGTSNFVALKSQGLLNMAYVKFRDTVAFNLATFEKGVDFSNAFFNIHASFYAAHFNDNPTFDKAQMPYVMDFRLVEFEPKKDTKLIIDLRTARLDSLRKQRNDPDAKCTLWLDGTDPSPFIVPSDRFYVTFSDTTAYEAKYNALETIIKNCRDAGMIESVEYWDVKYRMLQNIHRLGWWGYVVNWFNDWWWNFGYDRWRILLWWLPLFFTCFLVYNYFRIKTLWTKMYRDPELGGNFREPDEAVNLNFTSRWKRFSFAFFYTAVIYFGFKIRHESVNYNYTRGLLYLYFMYAVGTIHMAFAFSYILSAY